AGLLAGLAVDLLGEAAVAARIVRLGVEHEAHEVVALLEKGVSELRDQLARWLEPPLVGEGSERSPRASCLERALVERAAVPSYRDAIVEILCDAVVVLGEPEGREHPRVSPVFAVIFAVERVALVAPDEHGCALVTVFVDRRVLLAKHLLELVSGREHAL